MCSVTCWTRAGEVQPQVLLSHETHCVVLGQLKANQKFLEEMIGQVWLSFYGLWVIEKVKYSQNSGGTEGFRIRQSYELK